MFSSKKRLHHLALVLLILIGFTTRFYNLNWGSNIFFQPDENNMATALSQLTSTNFNPHFFAYGQFPLYLGYFSLVAIHQPVNFVSAIMVLRFWSAVFSVLSLFVFYFIFSSKTFLLLLIFTPGLIQLSHFGTTESLMIFIFAINLYFAKKILQNPAKKSLYFLAAFFSGIGFASKISALIFLTPVIVSILFSLRKYKNILYPTLILSFILLFTLVFSIIFSPYNLIEKNDFRSALSYEAQVATGSMKVFYTNQFLNSPSYIFQLVKIFPYTQGISIFIFSIFGLIVTTLKFKQFKNKKYIIVLVLSCLTYFMYFGQVYVKWTRFMSPIFFAMPFLATLLISFSRSRLIRASMILICIIPGIIFFKQYFFQDIRILASSWMAKNIPAKSIVLSEAGNVVNIPIADTNFETINFDFYNLEENKLLLPQLITNISTANYILVPSRRIFANQYGPLFPLSTNYYKSIADGSLGFEIHRKFIPQYDFLLDPEAAEETWSVFDHPTIRIYKKVKQLTEDEYRLILTPHDPANN